MSTSMAAPRQTLGSVKEKVAQQVSAHPKRTSLVAALVAAIAAGVKAYRAHRKH